MTNISIIIPTLNEEHYIEQTLQQVKKQMLKGDELIIADAKSTDKTTAIAKKYGTVVSSKKGRGLQMNWGRKYASGDWLLFLHADTQLHRDALKEIRSIPQNYNYGCFPLSFDKKLFRLKIIELYSYFRIKILKTMYGDQAIFVRTKLFNKVRGYPEYPLFEDIALSHILKKHGKMNVGKCPIVASTRYFLERGYWRTVYIINKLRILYFFGVSPEKLYKMYYEWKKK